MGTAVATPEPEAVLWDPKSLEALREEFDLSKSELVRRLARYPGLAMISWVALHRWETGAATPRAAYQVALASAVERLRRRLEHEKKARKRK